MGRLFGFLIWTSLLVFNNGQGLFDDMGDGQRSTDLALQFMRTELQQFRRSIERTVMTKLADVEKNIEIKIDQMETKNNESFSTIQTEQRLLSQKIESLKTNLSENDKEKISDLISMTQTEQKRLLRQEMVSITTNLSSRLAATDSKFDSVLNKANETGSVCSKKIEEEFDNLQTNLEKVLDEGIKNFTFVLGYELPELELRSLEMHSDCSEILKKYSGKRVEDGVYNIVGSLNDKKTVYCDMTTDNGGWTVIQRRVNGLVDFNRYWTDYKNGFGYADSEYWIGNDMLHKLTSIKPQELRVEMEGFNGEKAYAVYSSFSVGDETSKYQLHVNGYSGNAGNSLSSHNKMKFSTQDQDNDGSSGNCATDFESGWWFQSCFTANPNGKYIDSEKNGTVYILWVHWKDRISLKSMQLMIRPRA